MALLKQSSWNNISIYQPPPPSTLCFQTKLEWIRYHKMAIKKVISFIIDLISLATSSGGSNNSNWTRDTRTSVNWMGLLLPQLNFSFFPALLLAELFQSHSISLSSAAVLSTTHYFYNAHLSSIHYFVPCSLPVRLCSLLSGWESNWEIGPDMSTPSLAQEEDTVRLKCTWGGTRGGQ